MTNPRLTYPLDEVVITDRGAAEEVLDGLRDVVAKYGSASVEDLYTLVDLQPRYIDSTFFWTQSDINVTSVKESRGGFILDLPEPKMEEQL